MSCKSKKQGFFFTSKKLISTDQQFPEMIVSFKFLSFHSYFLITIEITHKLIPIGNIQRLKNAFFFLSQMCCAICGFFSVSKVYRNKIIDLKDATNK